MQPTVDFVTSFTTLRHDIANTNQSKQQKLAAMNRNFLSVVRTRSPVLLVSRSSSVCVVQLAQRPLMHPGLWYQNASSAWRFNFNDSEFHTSCVHSAQWEPCCGPPLLYFPPAARFRSRPFATASSALRMDDPAAPMTVLCDTTVILMSRMGHGRSCPTTVVKPFPVA